MKNLLVGVRVSGDGWNVKEVLVLKKHNATIVKSISFCIVMVDMASWDVFRRGWTNGWE